MNSLPFNRRYLPLFLIGLSALLVCSVVTQPQGPAAGALLNGLPDPTLASLDKLWDANGLFGASAPLAVDAGAWPDTPTAAFAALQSRADGPLDVHWDANSGIPDFLTGRDPTTRIPYTPSVAERDNPVAIARGFLDENRALFRLTSATSDLALTRVEPDLQLNYAHVRMSQVYHGIPVFGKQLVVHLDPQEQIVAVNGHIVPAIDVPTQPTISARQAEEIALQDLLETQLEPAERARVTTQVLRDKTQLMVYVDQRGKATLTWYVTTMTNSPLGQWRTFVNARRPVVVHRYDSAEHIKQRRTFSADNSTEIPGRLLIEEGERSRDQIAQAAHDGAGKVYDYYFNTFKRDGIDGQGSPLVSTVHYGSDPEDAENAAWISELQQMIYGDGGRIFRPLAYGLDVVGHEFTHGVIGSTSQLIYEEQSGALNESYADVFGVLIAGVDWRVGEAVVKSPPYPLPFLRSLEDPNAGGNYDPRDPLNSVGQPAHMNEYADLPLSRRTDNGGVHVNSGIPSHAAYLIAQALGNDKLQQIYYRTLTQYLSPDSRFRDAALATAQAATDLYGANEANAVRNAFAQVGIGTAGGDTGPPPSDEPSEPQRPTTPPPDETLPEGCADLIVSGGFESEAGWTQVSTAHTAIIDPELPHTGARSAWLGGTDQEPLQYIYQDVSIPANATAVQLSYFRLIHEQTEGVGGLIAEDAKFDVLIATTGGDMLASIEKLSSSQGDDTWQQVQADLSQFAGDTVRVVFAAENPRSNVSSFFVDDVSLVACTTGAGPAAPPTSSQDLVYLQGLIANNDTGRGVEGAQVFILKPGLSASQAAADDNLTRDEVLTAGVSDGNGVYQTEAPIPRGQTYSAIIIARGYRPIVADDGIDIPADASNPFVVDATLRRSR